MEEIRKAHLGDLPAIVRLIDGEFTKEGFGFVNREQVKTEVYKRRVIVATNRGELVGVRVGLGTVWNLVVAKTERGRGIGRKLIEYFRPHTVRVKSDPIGHLSKEQRDNFQDPTGFYEALGFVLWGFSYPKNFWQRGKGGKGQFHSRGSNPHIKIFRDPHAVLFMEGK